jgi:hypothetical protein
MSVQDFAVASQKLIWPGATGALPVMTVAVSVTTVPDDTVATAFPAEATDRVVVVVAGVVAGAAHAGTNPTQWTNTTTLTKHTNERKRAGISRPPINVR